MSNPVYGTKRHRLWRKMVLARDPVCRTCLHDMSTHADHITPLEQGGGWSLDNGQGLCSSCHSRKTMKENHGHVVPALPRDESRVTDIL